MKSSRSSLKSKDMENLRSSIGLLVRLLTEADGKYCLEDLRIEFSMRPRVHITIPNRRQSQK